MRRIAEFVLRHRRLVGLSWLIVVIAGIVLTQKTTSRLVIDFSLPGQPGTTTVSAVAGVAQDRAQLSQPGRQRPVGPVDGSLAAPALGADGGQAQIQALVIAHPAVIIKPPARQVQPGRAGLDEPELRAGPRRGRIMQRREPGTGGEPDKIRKPPWRMPSDQEQRTSSGLDNRTRHIPDRGSQYLPYPPVLAARRHGGHHPSRRRAMSPRRAYPPNSATTPYGKAVHRRTGPAPPRPRAVGFTPSNRQPGRLDVCNRRSGLICPDVAAFLASVRQQAEHRRRPPARQQTADPTCNFMHCCPITTMRASAAVRAAFRDRSGTRSVPDGGRR